MPNMRKCSETGAIIFDLTPQEQEAQDLNTELKEKLSLVDEKLKQLDALIEQNQKVSTKKK